MGGSNETPKTPPGRDRPAVSRPLIVVLRILLLLFAAGAVTAAVMIGLRDVPGGDARARYVCPMHPEVKAAQPGPCPICRMDLEPVGRDLGATSTRHREMPGMADMTAVENVRKHKIMGFVRMHSLLFDGRELRGPAWVEGDHLITAVFYNDQIAALGADEPGSFSLTQTPNIVFSVRRTADPVVLWDRSTSRIRFRVDVGHSVKAALPPEPGQVGWLELPRRSREVLAVPVSAVLQSPEGPYVLAAAASGAGLEKRSIEIGETFIKQGFAVVLSGLRVHERVVAKATFFLDADRRMGSHADEGGWVAP